MNICIRTDGRSSRRNIADVERVLPDPTIHLVRQADGASGAEIRPLSLRSSPTRPEGVTARAEPQMGSPRPSIGK